MLKRITLFSLTVLAVGVAVAQFSGTRSLTIAADLGEEASESGFAVIELFTSQGCSSCPRADANLRAIAKQAAAKNLPVYPLSFHVDYWNRLGWTDPFSNAKFSQRQRDYAKAFASNRIYTPQMIVNGTDAFVGSDANRATEAIQTALQQEAASKLKMTSAQFDAEQNSIRVKYDTQSLEDSDSLVVALVQKQAENEVDAGENAGRTLSHVNIVRDLQITAEPADSGFLTVPFSYNESTKDFEIIAFLQHRRTREISSSSKIAIE